MVSALPSEECPASAAANSAQPRGFLFWNWTRAGPAAYRSATFAAPSAANAAAVSMDSARKASARSGWAPYPAPATTAELTRSGCPRARCSAVKPPIDRPTT